MDTDRRSTVILVPRLVVSVVFSGIYIIRAIDAVRNYSREKFCCYGAVNLYATTFVQTPNRLKGIPKIEKKPEKIWLSPD